ncbi:MAG: rhomboid family intramembrane serine protease [Bacteroidota bacterium]
MTNAYRPTSLLPEVIKNLLIINGLFFLAQVVIDGLPALSGPMLDWLALWPVGTPEVARSGDGVAAVPQFYPWQLVTTAFLHGGIWHLVFNMYGLFLFGAGVERTLGQRRFLILYVGAVLGAGLLQLAVVSAPFVAGVGSPSIFPTVGASGGLLGVVAACAILFPRDEIYIIPFPFPIQMRWLAAGYVVLDLLGGFGAYNSRIAHFAHLGGFATGALMILFWRGRLPFRPRTRLA